MTKLSKSMRWDGRYSYSTFIMPLVWCVSWCFKFSLSPNSRTVQGLYQKFKYFSRQPPKFKDFSKTFIRNSSTFQGFLKIKDFSRQPPKFKDFSRLCGPWLTIVPEILVWSHGAQWSKCAHYTNNVWISCQLLCSNFTCCAWIWPTIFNHTWGQQNNILKHRCQEHE